MSKALEGKSYRNISASMFSLVCFGFLCFLVFGFSSGAGEWPMIRYINFSAFVSGVFSLAAWIILKGGILSRMRLRSGLVEVNGIIFRYRIPADLVDSASGDGPLEVRCVNGEVYSCIGMSGSVLGNLLGNRYHHRAADEINQYARSHRRAMKKSGPGRVERVVRVGFMWVIASFALWFGLFWGLGTIVR